MEMPMMDMTQNHPRRNVPTPCSPFMIAASSLLSTTFQTWLRRSVAVGAVPSRRSVPTVDAAPSRPVLPREDRPPRDARSGAASSASFAPSPRRCHVMMSRVEREREIRRIKTWGCNNEAERAQIIGRRNRNWLYKTSIRYCASKKVEVGSGSGRLTPKMLPIPPPQSRDRSIIERSDAPTSGAVVLGGRGWRRGLVLVDPSSP